MKPHHVPVRNLLPQIRRRFVNVAADPFTGRRIYLENAGGTLKLKSIFPVIRTLTALPDNSGRNNPTSRMLDAALAAGRGAVAALLGARSGQIIAEQSVTSMMFRLLRTLAQNVKGGNLVTTNLDHASIYDASHAMARAHGLQCRVAPLDPRTGVVPVSAVTNLIDRHTIALTVIHSSNILGTRNPVAEIVRAARVIKPGLFIVLDGAQHASHGLIDVEAYGADAYVMVPYKTYSKLGISFAHVSDRLAALPHDQLAGKPPAVWDLGTREIAAYACMSQVVEYLHWLAEADGQRPAGPRDSVIKGVAVVERLETELMRAFLHGVSGAVGLLGLPGVAVLGQTDRLEEREAIFAFTVRDRATAELVDEFARRGICLHHRVSDAYSRHTLAALGVQECVRVSACHYNTVGEVRRFLSVLATILRQRRKTHA